MKALVCILLLLETFVSVVQQQVDGGLNENEISQQISSEDRRQNPPQTDTLRAEASTDSQQCCNLEISNRTQSQVEELRKENRDREIAFSASLMESGDGNFGPFTTEITITYKKVFTNIGNAYNPFTGVFTAPLKGAYMFRISVFGHGGTGSSASIFKNGQRVISAHDIQAHDRLNSSNGVVLILEVGDVVYVRLWSGMRVYDSENNHSTFSGFLLFPLREDNLCRM
ncbi:complement C1q-like protein 4 [Megalobrama amblycephala]|uniref:complement C1q-like protein 4 n=1 Tax=Megalobrama amblycephala TaxID=75352 RepID=UPI0020145DF5|nr:complement C1q-like protein 4 [Megalobrama amblycephala]